VILDVDGTLVDSNDAHTRAWVDAFAERGVTVAYEDIRRAIGMGGDKLMPSVSGIAEDSAEGRAIAKRRAELFKEKWLPHLRPFPRVRELLQHFIDEGYTLAVATSAKQEEMQPLLDAAGVSDLIAERTSSDDASNSKPDPDIVQAALKSTACAANRAIMLGDTPYDVEAARRAGVHAVAFECGGWTRGELPAANEVYADAADLLERYESSIFAQLAPARQTR
jgi:HAD superfamily hydrolase (TIGR01509 family)